MRYFSSEQFSYSSSVIHQGYVIALASKLENNKASYAYRVLDVTEYDETAPIDEDHWGNVQTLTFPEEYRTLGMNLTTIPNYDSLAVSTSKFTLFSDQSYVYIFRRSDHGTLFFNRYILNMNTKQLSPAWETRYRRSKKTDYSSDRQDSFGSSDMDGKPFMEPIYDLSMIRPCSDTTVSAVVTENQQAGFQYLSIFNVNQSSQIEIFHFKRGDDYIPEISGKKIGPDGMVNPDKVITIAQYNLMKSPSVTLFYRQEQIDSAKGNTSKLKRAIRLMLALPVKKTSNYSTAVLDFAVTKDGMLSEVPDQIELSELLAPAVMPVINIDSRGLSTSGAILNYIQTSEGVSLLCSADGNVYLHCTQKQTESNGPLVFSVFSTDSSRSLYSIVTSETNTRIAAIGRQSGTLLNDTQLEVTGSEDNSLASIAITPASTDGNLPAENWVGVPTGVEDFTAVLNGDASDELSARKVINGEMLFFDYNSKWRILSCSLKTNTNISGTAAFVQSITVASNPETPLNCTIEVAENAATVTLSMTLGSITLCEIWRNVPLDGRTARNIINGISKIYQYNTETSAEYPVCKVTAGSGEIWFVSKTATGADVTVSIEKISSEICEITLQSKSGGDINQEVWPNMPRTPADIIKIINGEDTNYDYTKVSRTTTGSGNSSELFFCFDANTSLKVESQRIECSSHLVSGSSLATMCVWGSGTLDTTVIEQPQGVTSEITGTASNLFSFAVISPESNLNSVSVTTQTASKTSDGADCQWQAPVTRSSLNFQESAIEIEAQKNLDIEDSMCMEAWIYPDKFADDNVRIIHHASDTSSARYALGLQRDNSELALFAAVRESAVVTSAFPVVEDQWNHVAFSYKTGYSLKFDGSEYVDCGNGDTLNPGMEMTLEAWVKAASSISDKRIIVSKYAGVDNRKSYSLTLENGNFVLTVQTSALRNSSEGQFREITHTIPVETFGEWSYVAATVKFKDIVVTQEDNTVRTDTVINLQLCNNSTVNEKEAITIENEALQINASSTTLTVGALKKNNQPTISESFNISEARIWNKALTANDLYNNYIKRDIGENSDALISWWNFNEGNGREAYDSKKVNNAIISSSLLWRFSRQGAMWNIYINGEPQELLFITADSVGGYQNSKTYIGAMEYDHPISQCFIGCIDEVRIWNRALTREEILDCIYSALSGKERGLEAYWQLDAGSGDTVEDKSNHNNGGTFGTPPSTSINSTFTLNDTTELTVGMQLTNVTISQIYSSPIEGKFDFSLLTGGTSQFTATWTGSEKLKLFIKDGSTIDLTSDQAVNLPSTASLQLQLQVVDRQIDSLTYKDTNPLQPTWTWDHIAPVSIDAPWCYEVPAGQPQPDYNATSCGIPVVTEYGDVQIDTNGNMTGSSKRCYVYMDTSGKVCLQTSFKIGEMTMLYIGQVQTKPTLIGFIEGAPPVPSENLTINDPKTDDYVGTSSVTLSENNSDVYRFTGKSDSHSDFSLDAKIGLFLGTETSAGVGAETEVFKLNGKIGLHVKAETSSGTSQGVEAASGTDEAFTSHLDLCGFWEVEKDYDNDGIPRYLNPETGQRYIPNNMGYALVKSSTADLYAMKMQTTGAVVSYVTIPNKDIPKDWNIIMFPLNPSYIKNGTLDGMVGLVADSDYPNAIHGVKGSYFKPVEAYALKQRIDQEKETVKAYYEQSSYSLSAYTSIDAPNGALMRDWSNKVSKRSLANTYVWTAQGGLYKQEIEFSDIKQNSYGNSYSINTQIGAYGSLEIRAGGIGLDLEADVLFGSRWEGSIVTTEDHEDAFSLDVDVTAEGWLNQRNEEGNYEEYDCPGKVLGYRFMSYYLAPDVDNFSAFSNEIVDKEWLYNSNNPDALALQDALGDENPVWRVLHRVTYVSRVSPPFKISPDESDAPAEERPVCINWNSWFITLVSQALGSISPTTGAIDTAVDSVLDNVLTGLDPYWNDFYVKAHQDPDSIEAMQLYDIRKTAKSYMISYYKTK